MVSSVFAIGAMDERFPCHFDELLRKNVPHILEHIMYSLDYESYKTCFEVSTAWKELLTSDSFQIKGKSVFCDEILKEEDLLYNAPGDGNKDAIGRLLSTGLVDINCVRKVDGCGNTTPLQKASQEGHKDGVRVLLALGADPNKAKEEDGWTPLHEAASRGDKDVVQLLLEREAIPNKADKTGWTPLHRASYKGHKNVAQLLIDRGADPNRADEDGWTPLHGAAMWGHKDVVQLLLDRGADPNQADIEGQTPLHEAAMRGKKDVVQLLLDGRAGPNKADGSGRTPLHYAAEEGHKDVRKGQILVGQTPVRYILRQAGDTKMCSSCSLTKGQTLIRRIKKKTLCYIMLQRRVTKIWSNSS